MAGGDWKDWRLLIVDGDKEFLDWTGSVFKRAGAREVRSTDSPAQAMEMLQTYKADAAMIGIELKGIAGVDYLHRLRNRKISPQPDLPLILVVSAADPKALRNACQIGIENFVPKPVNEETLIKRVAATINFPQRFVANRYYFGPDRRRKEIPFDGPERRRANQLKATLGNRPRGDNDGMPLVDVPTPKTASGPAVPLVDDPPPPMPVPAKPAIPLVDDAPAPRRSVAIPVALVEPASPKPVREAIPLTDPVAAKAAPATREDWKDALGPEKTKDSEEEEPLKIDPRILDAHQAWLRSKGKAGARASFNQQDLHGVDLANINLTSASFNGADLTGANCENVDFSGADLRRAILTDANINGGKLGVSQMRHCDLERASLNGAILRGTDLAGANLQGASLKEADFSGAILLSTNIKSADLSGATGLTQAQIDRCIGNDATILPPGLRITNED